MLSAQGQDPILAAVPKDATSLLVIRDPLPHIEALLASPEIAEIARATADLQQELLGMTMQPATLQKQLGLFVTFVPTEIVVAAPPEAMVALARLGSCLLAGFCASQQKDAEATATALRLCAQEHMAKVQMPAVTAWVRARNERTAEQWFEAIGETLDRVADDGLVVTATGDVLTVALQPSKINGGKMMARIREIALDPTPLEALATTFTVTLDGDRIALQLGTAAAPGLPASALGQLWQPSGDQLLFGKLDMAGSQTMWGECTEWLYPAIESMDENLSATVVPMAEAVSRLAEMAPRSVSSIVVNNGLQFVLEERFNEDASVEFAAPPPELLRCLDPKLGAFALLNLPFDVVLSGLLDQVESELASRSHRPDPLAAYEALTSNAAGVMDFLAGESSAVFGSGVVVVSSEVTMSGLVVAGMPMRDLPVLALAAVAPADDAESASSFCAQLGELVAQAVGVEVTSMWRDEDLGFGLPTRTLQWQQLLPADVKVTVNSGFLPHHVQRGELMIVSTDPTLTRTLLARMDGTIETAPPSADTIAWSFTTGEQMASMCNMLGQWLLELAKVAPKPMPMAEEVHVALQVAARAMQQVECYDQRLTMRDDWMRDEAKLLLKPAAVRAAARQGATPPRTKKPKHDEAKVGKATADVKEIDGAARMFRIKTGRVPTMQEITAKNAEGLAFLDFEPRDPWGNAYLIRELDGTKVEILCTGPDGKAGTEDDLSSRRPK